MDLVNKVMTSGGVKPLVSRFFPPLFSHILGCDFLSGFNEWFHLKMREGGSREAVYGVEGCWWFSGWLGSALMRFTKFWCCCVGSISS